MRAITANDDAVDGDEGGAGIASPENASRFGLIDSKRFSTGGKRLEWLVEKILVRGQPAVIGGPPKSLKTSLAIDLAISLGTGKKFLGEFNVPKRCRVAVFSGESGEAALIETAQRICKSKGVAFDRDARVYWSLVLPRMSEPGDLAPFVSELMEKKIKVVIVDPLYLCLHGGAKSVSPSNLYEIGPILQQFSNACLGSEITPIIVHHATKTSEKKAKDEPPSLRDLAYSGIVEFTRQWIQVKHREEHVVGTGIHKMSMSVGGSAGHASTWRLDINEGNQKADFSGRRWDVSVSGFEFNSDE
jgi:hypothetical protein